MQLNNVSSRFHFNEFHTYDERVTKRSPVPICFRNHCSVFDLVVHMYIRLVCSLQECSGAARRGVHGDDQGQGPAPRGEDQLRPTQVNLSCSKLFINIFGQKILRKKNSSPQIFEGF